MTLTLGILARLEAKPGKGDDLAAFLRSGREIAEREEGTVTWYAFTWLYCGNGRSSRARDSVDGVESDRGTLGLPRNGFGSC